MATNDVTVASNLVDPVVLADTVSYTLNNQLRFTALAEVDDTLVGVPGSKLQFPFFQYSGDAVDLTDGVEMDVDNIAASTTEVQIKEAGKAIGVTDMAISTGVGDPFGEAAKQAGLALANKIDNDLLSALQAGSVLKYGSASTNATVVSLQSALDIFADEDDSTIVLLASPKAASQLRLDAGANFTRGSELGAQAIISGTYGELLGVQIVRTAKLQGGEAYLVKITPDSPALKLVQKKAVKLETERNAKKRQTDVVATAEYAPYVFDNSKIVQISFANVDKIAKPARRQDAPITKSAPAAPASK